MLKLRVRCDGLTVPLAISEDSSYAELVAVATEVLADQGVAACVIVRHHSLPSFRQWWLMGLMCFFRFFCSLPFLVSRRSQSNVRFALSGLKRGIKAFHLSLNRRDPIDCAETATLKEVCFLYCRFMGSL